MNIRVLGKYGRFAPPNEATNGYLIEYNDKKILLDFGAGCLGKLLDMGLTDEIDAVILTHLHFDHISDIFIMDYMRGYRKNKQKNEIIPVYLPNTPQKVKEIIADCKSYKLIPIEAGATTICGLNIEFLESVHPVETYSVAINTDKNRIVYTSDISDSLRLREIVYGADIVIGDACILDCCHNENSPHVSVKALGEAMPESTRLYLAHLSMGEVEGILAEGKRYHNNTELIRDLSDI